MSKTVVIGVGNDLRQDDGVGPAVVRLLRRQGLSGAELVDAAGETTELIGLWEGATTAIVVDAVRVTDAVPGRIHRLQTASGTTSASSHGLGLGDAVELARQLDKLPGRLVLFAVEVSDVGIGAGLSPAAECAVPRVAAAVAREVAQCALPK